MNYTEEASRSSGKETTLKPVTEKSLMQKPMGEELFVYARNVIASMIKTVELKWHQERTGMTLDDFIADTAARAIILTEDDYQKGLFRQEGENSFKNFFWFRIKKAFFLQLEELSRDSQSTTFDESMGKYYEDRAAGYGTGSERDEDSCCDSTDAEEAPCENEPEDGEEAAGDTPKTKKAADPTIRRTLEVGSDESPYSYSHEKAMALEENRRIKMKYVERILLLVSQMSPKDQMLFKMKFQIDFSEDDCRMWEAISQQPHVKDPYGRMAHEKFGCSEGYAKKRISMILSKLKSDLYGAGYTREAYRESVAMPGTMHHIIAEKNVIHLFDFDVQNLSEDDCRDILLELAF